MSTRAGRSGREQGRWGREEGAATLLVAVWAGVLVSAGLAALVLVSGLQQRARLGAAADLAALAAAAGTLGDPAQACRAASLVAQRNDVHLDDCVIEATQARVVVSTWLSMPGGVPGPIQMGARAHAALTVAARP